MASDMPSGSIGEHDHVLVVANRARELIEELLHRLGVDVRHHQRKGIVGARLDGGEDVGEREAFVGETRRTLPSLPPDVADAALLTNTRLILEEQSDALALMCIGNLLQRSR